MKILNAGVRYCCGLALTLFISPLLAKAFDCPTGIAFYDTAEAAQLIGYTNGLLLRTWTLAQTSCTGPFSNTQRLALNNEYQALVQEIDHVRTTISKYISPDGRHFLEQLIDSNNLGVAGRSLVTAQQSCAAAYPNLEANNQLSTCYRTRVGELY